jgi:3-oxoacyl-[acyl-carrier protein] reductase
MTDIEDELQQRSDADETWSPEPPRRRDRDYNDFAVGDYVHFERRFSAADFAAFAELSGDRNPLHCDAQYARRCGFKASIVPLQLASAPLSAIAGMLLPGRRSLVLDHQLRALEPIHYEQPVEYSAKIAFKHDAHRTLALQIIAFQGPRVLLEGRMHVRVREDSETEANERSFEANAGNALHERVALVTGATGAIGQAVVRLLARRGWKLILQGRSCDRVEALARECRREGTEAFPLVSGLAGAIGRRELAERLDELPAATALVHAASPRIDAALDELIEVNYAALRDLTEALTRRMLQRQHGRVLLVGSAAADYPQPGWEHYAAAKQAAAGYVRAFHQRYAPYGLFGQVVAPGYVLGEFSEAWRPDDAECLLPEEAAEAIAEELETSQRRPGGYLRLEPGSRRRGEFGFHQPRVELARQQEPASREQATADATLAPSTGDLDETIRRFFRLPADASLAEAGLGVTPGWDSLGHLELLLCLESTFALSFSSGELNQTTRYADLQRLVDAKRRTA